MATNGCSNCAVPGPPNGSGLESVVQRGRLISALFGGVVAGIAPQTKPHALALFLRIGGTALAAWQLAVFIEKERTFSR